MAQCTSFLPSGHQRICSPLRGKLGVVGQARSSAGAANFQLGGKLSRTLGAAGRCGAGQSRRVRIMLAQSRRLLGGAGAGSGDLGGSTEIPDSVMAPNFHYAPCSATSRHRSKSLRAV